MEDDVRWGLFRLRACMKLMYMYIRYLRSLIIQINVCVYTKNVYVCIYILYIYYIYIYIVPAGISAPGQRLGSVEHQLSQRTL